MSGGYAMEGRIGRIQTAELDYLWRPTNVRTRSTAKTCGLVMLHGSGSPNEYVDTDTQNHSAQLAAVIASAGIPCIAGDMGGQGWANDTVMARITAAWNYLITQYSVRTDKVLLLGASMGGAAVLRYSQVNPTKVAGIVGLLPLVDLVGFYTANTGGLQTQIGSAWGVTAPAALPSGAAIAANASLAAGIPFLAGYSSVDALIVPSTVTNYATTVGGTATLIDSTYGHSDGSIAGMPQSTVLNFLLANGG